MADRKSVLARLKQWARRIKQDVHALYLAARDPRTPWLPKVLAIAVAAYALSPIDLIPDFIPVLGYLDDVILLPIAIAFVVRLIPETVMDEHRAAAATAGERPISHAGLTVIVCIWIAAAALLLWLAWQRSSSIPQ